MSLLLRKLSQEIENEHLSCSLSLLIWINCWRLIDLVTAAYGKIDPLLNSYLILISYTFFSFCRMVLYNIWKFNRIAILAFHKALADQPRSPLVVAAFSLAVHNCGDILEAVKIAKKITRPHDRSFFELVEPAVMDLDFKTLLDEVMDLDASVKDALNQMTDGYFISKAMAAYPQAPYSDLVITL